VITVVCIDFVISAFHVVDPALPLSRRSRKSALDLVEVIPIKYALRLFATSIGSLSIASSTISSLPDSDWSIANLFTPPVCSVHPDGRNGVEAFQVLRWGSQNAEGVPWRALELLVLKSVEHSRTETAPSGLATASRIYKGIGGPVSCSAYLARKELKAGIGADGHR
jgi:hypothetical protein